MRQRGHRCKGPTGRAIEDNFHTSTTHFHTLCGDCQVHGLIGVVDVVVLNNTNTHSLRIRPNALLPLLQVHGFPKVMGVLTHLDGFREASRLKKTKKKLKQRFWTEIYDGAKLFYLSGIQHGAQGVGEEGLGRVA